jgi:hypothetical protein
VAPPEGGDHRHHGQQQQDVQRLALAEADGLRRERAHHHDGGVDRVGVEEAPDDEAQQAGRLARVADRGAQLAPGTHRIEHAEPLAARVALLHAQEDRHREDGEQGAHQQEAAGGGPAVGIGREAEEQP